MGKYVGDFKRRFDLQFFAEGGSGGDDGSGGQGGGSNAGSGNGGNGNSGQGGGQTYSQADIDRIAGEREERARKAALKSFFEQQGYSQEQVEKLLKEDKERREAAKTEAERLKEEKTKAEAEAAKKVQEANARIARTEFKIAAQAAGIPADRLDAALKLADLSGLEPDDKGDIPADKVKAAVDATLKENPFLKAQGGQGGGNLGGGSNGGGQGGDDDTPGSYGKKRGEAIKSTGKSATEARDNYFK